MKLPMLPALSLMVAVALSVGSLPAVGADLTAPETAVHVGMYSDDWQSSRDLRAMARITGSAPAFVGTFHHLLEGPDNTNWILEQAWQAGGTPIANLEVNQLAFSIAAEHHDDELRMWAIDVLTWLERGDGRSVIIAPMAEANGDWVSWGMDPLNFQIAFRRIVDTFRELGLDGESVRWMFAPNSVSAGEWAISDYWPGDDYVDVMGFSAYNFGGDAWQAPADLFEPTVRELADLAPGKPIVVAQVGSASEGGDKDQWLVDMFDYVESEPQVVGFVYFNFDKERDWKIWRDGSVSDGFLGALETHVVASGQPLTGWFRPGPILIDPLAPLVSTKTDPPPAFRGADLSGGDDTIPASRVRPE